MTAALEAMPERKKRNDLVAKVDAEVLRMARIVAAYEDTSMAELLSSILRPVLEQRLEKHQSDPKPRPRKRD